MMDDDMGYAKRVHDDEPRGLLTRFWPIVALAAAAAGFVWGMVRP